MPAKTAVKLKKFTKDFFSDFPWMIMMKDWTGDSYYAGLGKGKHWSKEPLIIEIKTETAAKDFMNLNALRFLDRYLDSEVELEGNFYLLMNIRDYAKMHLSLLKTLPKLLLNKAFLFQNISRATKSVKSHYDIPQDAVNVYLDKVYMSYSCGMFEEPERIDTAELIKVGKGQNDKFDSLEKAQWRKFKDAVDYIKPKKGETMLDVGCGYGGQLVVALENHPFGKVVGWTHSSNQVTEGKKLLSKFKKNRWELHEGDYRLDNRIYDHITSTGMISHVGPRGLVPYVKEVRKRIKKGGRYLHHALMAPYSKVPLDSELGVAFSKKYVWPGFHWFTVGEHIKVLEENGFEVAGCVNLTRHYCKTSAAWYERMISNRIIMRQNLGEATFRAWRLYLSGVTAGFNSSNIHVYRIYCKAV